jgi:hypothetical protein
MENFTKLIEKSLLAYELSGKNPYSLTIRLIRISSYLSGYLEAKKVFLSSDGISIIYQGQAFKLKERVPPSGKPEGIILPRLQGLNSSWTSERSNRHTMDMTPRSFMRGPKGIIIEGSERYTLDQMQDEISFKCESDRSNYSRFFCKAMAELCQAASDTPERKKRVDAYFILP